MLNSLVQFFPAAVSAATTPAAAAALYERGKTVPRTDTRFRALMEDHLAIDGLFQANVITKSLLFYAFPYPGWSPKLLKVSTKASALQELAVWAAIAPQEGEDVNLAGPITRVDLKRDELVRFLPCTACTGRLRSAGMD